MNLLGIALPIFGFLWIAWDAVEGFNVYQHERWVWQSQHLSEGETVKRSDAVSAMRELSLALKDQHRVVLLPALLRLAGGLMAAFGRKRQRGSGAELDVNLSTGVRRFPKRGAQGEGQNQVSPFDKQIPGRSVQFMNQQLNLRSSD